MTQPPLILGGQGREAHQSIAPFRFVLYAGLFRLGCIALCIIAVSLAVHVLAKHYHSTHTVITKDTP